MKMYLGALGLLAAAALLAATAGAPPSRAGVAATHAGFGIERDAYATSANGSTSTKQAHVWRSMTLAASPLKVVFGKTVTLSGLLTDGGTAVGGQPVALSALPFGSSSFTSLATVTTSTTGAYSTTSMPKKQTIYQATTGFVDRCCFVEVKVAQLLTLSALPRDGGKVYVKGRLAPEKRARVIVIQVRSGKRWKVLARVKTTRRSTFKAVRALNPGHTYHFRATTRGYPGLLSGTSRTLRLRR